MPSSIWPTGDLYIHMKVDIDVSHLREVLNSVLPREYRFHDLQVN